MTTSPDPVSSAPARASASRVRPRRPLHWVAFGFGVGLARFAPGTWGTLVGVLLYLPLAQLGLPLYLVAVAGAALLGILICGRTAQDLGVSDPSGIVWDEIVGYWITMVAVPIGWTWLVAGFLLFRFFDIVKPWPISWLNTHVKGGVGIMVDDVAAGLVACAVLHGVPVTWLAF